MPAFAGMTALGIAGVGEHRGVGEGGGEVVEAGGGGGVGGGDAVGGDALVPEAGVGAWMWARKAVKAAAAGSAPLGRRSSALRRSVCGQRRKPPVRTEPSLHSSLTTRPLARSSAKRSAKRRSASEAAASSGRGRSPATVADLVNQSISQTHS